VKLIDALEVLRLPISDSLPGVNIYLACSFTPLHLKTFLAAQLRLRFPRRGVGIREGLYGDLVGSIERLEPSGIEALVMAIEWGDLDPRLTIRNLGGWLPASLADIGNSAERAACRLERAIKRISDFVPTVVSLPTLPLPPMFSTRPGQAASLELELRHIVTRLAVSLSKQIGIRIVNGQLLDEMSSPSQRFDVKSEVVAGFPYTLSHASSLGELIASLIHNPPPKKGLITDLDDTLWAGILGEEGVEGISWHLERQTHMHAVYQQFLTSLAGSGILIGIASKNDPSAVERAFERKDLLISKNEIYPFEVHWSRKSESVSRILRTWNLGADSVVFIDDSPMEVAEVKAAFPEIECIVYPKGDFQAIWDLLKRLRTAFGKPFLTKEDSLRMNSIRNASAWRDAVESSGQSSDDFLRAAEATIVFDCSRHGRDMRAFELVNKTNQFNLNGRRFTELEWLTFFTDPAAFLLSVSYEDKYGPLGKVAVILGKVGDGRLQVKSWVMSCRAFSRRIEYQTLKYLFDNFGQDEIVFDYQTTPRNSPLRDFFAEVFTGPPDFDKGLSRESFATKVPLLFHRIEGMINV
jgi:FkbH-like protein